MKASITMTVSIEDEDITQEEFLAWLKFETGDGSDMTRKNPLWDIPMGDHVIDVVIRPLTESEEVITTVKRKNAFQLSADIGRLENRLNAVKLTQRERAWLHKERAALNTLFNAAHKREGAWIKWKKKKQSALFVEGV